MNNGTPLVRLGQGEYRQDFPAAPQSIEPQKLTHSRMQAFKTCPKKHYYSYELGIRPIETAKPLRLGSAVHLGLDLRKQGKSGAEAVLAAMKPYDNRPAWADDDEKAHEWEVERETVGCLLSGYFWRWEIPDLAPELSIAEVVASEFAFDLPIKNPDTRSASRLFRLAGKIDGIVRLGDGRLAILEHKTVSEDIDPVADYWVRLRMDQQISLYMLAARAMGHNVQTVLYDCIRKPTIRPERVPLLDENGVKIVVDTATGERVRSKDGKKWRESGDAAQGFTLQSRIQTPQEFAEKLMADITERPDWYFARQEIPRLASDLDEFSAELWQIQQNIRLAQIDGRNYRNTGACKFNNSKCAYFNVCHPTIDPTQIPSGFVRVTNVHPELELQ